MEKRVARLREKRKRADAENAGKSDPVKKAQLALKEVKKGDTALEKGKLDEAIKHYKTALELTPNAPKFRFAYAQLLYLKAVTYGYGWKEEIEYKSEEDKRQAIIYCNKCLQQLKRCDEDWNHEVESVPFAMGRIYFMLSNYDNAIRCFERVLESDRTSDAYRDKITKTIELLKQQKRREREKNKKK